MSIPLLGTRQALKLVLIVGIWAVALVGMATEAGPETPNCDLGYCSTCPDDYCCKPMPGVPCASRGHRDGYCRKPMPCPPCPLRCRGPNDYCPKAFCFWLPMCSPAWYSCEAPKSGPPVKVDGIGMKCPELRAMGVSE